jgi:hypothetical protein
MLWFGTIKLPEPNAERYRLVIKEFEKINVAMEEPTGPIIDKRLVYAEIIDI